MSKYTLIHNRITGERGVRINSTGEIVKETDNPQEYTRLRKLRMASRARAERDQAMRDCGLVKVKGALGGTYWE